MRFLSSSAVFLLPKMKKSGAASSCNASPADVQGAGPSRIKVKTLPERNTVAPKPSAAALARPRIAAAKPSKVLAPVKSKKACYPIFTGIGGISQEERLANEARATKLWEAATAKEISRIDASWDESFARVSGRRAALKYVTTAGETRNVERQATPPADEGSRIDARWDEAFARANGKRGR